jgi:hypothetical protein
MIEMEDAVYAAKLWLNGKQQRAIAAMLGFNQAAPVSTAIRVFLEKYSSEFHKDPYNYLRRREFVEEALAKFEKKHGHLPKSFRKEALRPARKNGLPKLPVLADMRKALPVEQRLDLPIDKLPLSVRLSGALLHGNSFRTVRDIYAQSERELLRTPNLGLTSLSELREVLRQLGLPRLREDVGDIEPVSEPTVLEQLERIEAKIDMIHRTLGQILHALEMMNEAKD